MGAGSWDPGTYTRSTKSKITSGTNYGYSSAQAAAPAAARKAHVDLDPKRVAGKGSVVEGQIIRESRDNDDHPMSVPVAVWFDETGSMGMVPRTVQTKLTTLFGLLLRKGYLEDPQVLIGAYGDTHSDRVPLQVSQFESDNRIDDALDNVYLEGYGGGNGGEDQALAWYYTAHHTATDAWEKREKKGYVFFIGDEITHTLRPDTVRKYIGVGGDDPVHPTDHKTLVSDLLSKWEAYVFVINNGSAHNQRSVQFYTDLFGSERVLVVENEEAIAETIALTIGMAEGVIDLDDGVDDLKAAGASDSAIRQATNALALYKGRTNVVVTGDSPKDIDLADDDSVARI